MANVNVVPLESNPDVLNSYLLKFGVPPNWSIVDVLCLEDTVECSVPEPVLAVIFVFPVTSCYENYKRKQEKAIYNRKFITCPNISNNVFFMKQYPPNAGGTIAIIHSLANNTDKISLSEGTFRSFLAEAKGLTPEARGEMLTTKYTDIIYAHMETAQYGQSAMVSADVPANHHFVTFVHADGFLYELDGRRSQPVNQGTTQPECLLADAGVIIQQYMALEPKELRYSVLALSATSTK